MNRFGWFLLLLFLLAGTAFFLLVRRADLPATTAQAPTPTGPVIAGRLPIPVEGVRADQLSDTWGDSRGGGVRVHNAIDIMAPRGTPVRSATGGVIEKIFESKDGGHTVYVRTADRQWQAYYAHLDSYAPGLAEGQPVRVGTPLGRVGFTGSASAEGPHLHFEWHRMKPNDGWWQGEPINPYPLMAAR
jgi:peptidoglycan LD-endopeptidase LytH